jgi:hypothetical protein
MGGGGRRRELQLRWKEKRVRHGPIEEQKAAREELTEGGRLAAALHMIPTR